MWKLQKAINLMALRQDLFTEAHLELEWFQIVLSVWLWWNFKKESKWAPIPGRTLIDSTRRLRVDNYIF